MRFNKRASLEISIQAIVIVVLAMTLLGLGLGFIRKQFKGLGDIGDEVTSEVKRKILDDLITSDKKVSFSRSEILIDKGSSTILTVGIRNKKDAPLRYKMRFTAISGPNNQQLQPDSLSPWFQLAPFNTQNYVLAPADAEVRNIRLSIPTQGVTTGSYFLTFEVLEDPFGLTNVYAQQDFFIVVRG